jgi:hypothetical protein
VIFSFWLLFPNSPPSRPPFPLLFNVRRPAREVPILNVL